jgi:predicted ATPase/DNA-binding winged helix-turn-helix (wHTH) protein
MKRFESFALDTRNECLWRDGSQLNLPPKPFAILRYLIENPGRLVTHNELLDALWPETYVQPQVLRTYVLELRKFLGDDARQPRFIQTLPKRGFCFVAHVVDDPQTAAVPGKPLEPEPQSDIPRPDKTQDARLAGIVGRDSELALMQALAGQIGAGRRQTIFVSGEVGIGKTALADGFCRWLASCSATVARGQCVEGLGEREEYYPVMEMLSQLCASEDGERACRILSALAPGWLGARRRASGDSALAAAPPARQGPDERMPGDLCTALEELAATRPLVLVFEDVHWADEPTLRLVSALARRRGPCRLMIVATMRPQDGAKDGPELALRSIQQDLLMRRLCAEIALRPLKKTAMKEMLSRELRQDALPPGLAGFVHRRSEGNPLFAIAILEHLISQEFLVRTKSPGPSLGPSPGPDADPIGSWTQRAPFEEMEAGVPDGLARMIELEVERLSPSEQSLLEAGSLVPVAFPAWSVAAALKQSPEETEEACDALARRLYFLERAGQDELPDGTHSAFYVFSHGLFREVLYRRQAPAKRAKRHIRIAERLSELFPGRESSVARDVAMHLEAARALSLAVDALRRAAEDAGRRKASAEAADLLERALHMADKLKESSQEPDAQEIAERLQRDLRKTSAAIAVQVQQNLCEKA